MRNLLALFAKVRSLFRKPAQPRPNVRINRCGLCGPNDDSEWYCETCLNDIKRGEEAIAAGDVVSFEEVFGYKLGERGPR